MFLSADEYKKFDLKNFWTIPDVVFLLFGEDSLEEADGAFRSTDSPDWILQKKMTPIKASLIRLFRKIDDAKQLGRFGSIQLRFFDPVARCEDIHPLRIIDWLEDEEILSFIKYENRKICSGTLKLTEMWNKRSPEINDIEHDVDYKNLMMADVWTLSEIMIVLFGEVFACRYPSKIYHKIKPICEEQKWVVNDFISSAIEIGGIKKYPKHTGVVISNIPPLRYYGADPCYDNAGFLPHEIFKILTSKGFPIPDELTKGAYNAANKKTLAPLLKSLRGEMQLWLENGCPIPVADSIPEKLPPAPQTIKARKTHLKKKLIKVATSLLNKNPELQFPDFMSDSDTKGAIYDSGLSVDEQPANSTYQKCLRKARRQLGLPAPSGRPRKP